MGEKDGKPWKFRNLIKVEIAGKTVELHQDKDLPLNRHKLAGGFVPTTELYVRNVEEAELPEIKEWLEGFANCCPLRANLA